MTFDLASIRQSDTATIEITHPVTGDPTGWVIELAGPGHPATLAQRNRMLAKARAAQGKADPTAEQLDADAADFYSARIVGWAGLSMAGKEISYSPDKAKEIISDYGYSFVKDQINAALSSAASFLSAPAKS